MQIFIALSSGIDEYIRYINIIPFKHYESSCFSIKQKEIQDIIISILHIVATQKPIMFTYTLFKVSIKTFILTFTLFTFAIKIDG